MADKNITMLKHKLARHALAKLATCGLLFTTACGPDIGSGDNYYTDTPLTRAAYANLARIDAEIDRHHLGNYRLEGDRAEQFLGALHLEYQAHPEILQRRLEALASMVYFSAPEIETSPGLGRVTPFHGMDEAAFEALMDNEDLVFKHHMQVNGGSPKGVRPFSVCETSYLIQISKAQLEHEPFVSDARVTDYSPYAHAYKAFAESCAPRDLSEWYNFRGLGGLRPSWVESNLADRFLRRMLSKCRKPKPEWEADCASWDANRFAYRQDKNTELALRTFYYAPGDEPLIDDKSFEAYMETPQNAGVFVEDRNGDGIGEWIATGSLRTNPGADVALPKGTPVPLPAEITLEFSADATLESDTGPVSATKGMRATLLESSQAKLTSSQRTPLDMVAIQLPNRRKLQLDPGTKLFMESGAVVTVAYGEAVEVKLTAALELPLLSGQSLELTIDSPTSGILKGSKFAGELHVDLALDGGGQVQANIDVEHIVAYDEIDPAWHPQMRDRADFGLGEVFADPAACNQDHPKAASCPMLKRFYGLIDRHEYFYKTYSGLQPTRATVSQQPSPLVACSITLRASHHWDKAGTPNGGVAGFIYLMRIPFDQILSGDRRSIDTLGLLADGDEDGEADGSLYAGPDVLDIQDVYQDGATIDMNRVWLDIATLSNNQYQGEHEISKFGSVHAEQIEGILVVRRPAAMAPTP
jgi:hypothetical protein